MGLSLVLPMVSKVSYVAPPEFSSMFLAVFLHVFCRFPASFLHVSCKVSAGVLQFSNIVPDDFLLVSCRVTALFL